MTASERDFTSDSFYKFLGEHRLMGSRCKSCGALHLPPRAICSNCYGSDMGWEAVGGDGTLLAFTAIHIAPTAMIEAGYGRDNPYCAGIVKLDEGPAISAQILNADLSRPDSIAIGARVHVAFVDRGEGEARRTFLAFQL